MRTKASQHGDVTGSKEYSDVKQEQEVLTQRRVEGEGQHFQQPGKVNMGTKWPQFSQSLLSVAVVKL